MNAAIPVLIVGAGPTGLTMAIELHRRDIPFRIIDKQNKPVPTSNALAAQTRTLEVWDDEGLLDNALSRGIEVKEFNLYADKKKILHADFSLLPSSHPYVLAIAQHETETMLIEHLQKNNVTIEMDVELVEFAEKENIVTATLKHADGQIEKIQAEWIIGCDGNRSIIRENSNIAFLGKELPQHFVLADAKINSTLPPNSFNGFLSEHGISIYMKYNKEYTRLIADVTHDAELSKAKSLTLEQIKRLALERCSFPLEISDPDWSSGFWIHERIASAYRSNRIFLAGDAAHVHSPAGGQGMNTGIQDSYNLAWKLALVIQGHADVSLLDSYYAERAPVAKRVLKDTTLLTNMMTTSNPIISFIRNVTLANLTKIKFFQKKFLSHLTELDIKYKQSRFIKNVFSETSGLPVGKLMPNVGDTDLHDSIRGTEHCILLFPMTLAELDKCIQLKNSVKHKFPDLFKFILINTSNNFSSWDEIKIFDEQGVIYKKYDISKPTIFMIRPDKYIGFKGELQSGYQFMEYLEGIYNAN